jgi:hypothetical protein
MEKTDRILFLILLGICVLYMLLNFTGRSMERFIATTFSTTVYVDPVVGNDVNPGTSRAKPMKTISSALVKYPKDVRITLLKGVHAPFIINNRTNCEVSGEDGAAVSGLVNIPSSLVSTTVFKPSNAKVHYFKLPTNVTIPSPNQVRGYGFPNSTTPLPELFMDGKKYELPRWPSDGYLHYQKVNGGNNITAPGSKCSHPDFATGGAEYKVPVSHLPPDFKSWTDTGKTSEIYVSGVKSMNWEWNYNKLRNLKSNADGTVTITLDSCEGNYLQPDVKVADWQYLDNVKYELKTPGQCYLDTDTRTFYFIPVTPIGSKSRIFVNCNDTPLCVMNNCTNITLSNVLFAGNRGDAVRLSNCSAFTITKCNVVNVAGSGIVLDKCTNGKVTNTLLQNIGMTGIALNQRPTVANANITKSTVGDDNYAHRKQNLVVDTCILRNIAYYNYTSNAIVLDGIGNTVTNCIIDGFPFGGIYVTGAEHLIQNNELMRGVQWTSDMGMIYAYTGFDILGIGTRITNNYFHSMSHAFGSGLGYALYLDDGSSGFTVKDNYFENVTSYLHGGHCIDMTDNILADSNLYITQNGSNSDDVQFQHMSVQWADDWNKADKNAWLKAYPEYVELFSALVYDSTTKVKTLKKSTVLDKVRTGYKLNIHNVFHGSGDYMNKMNADISKTVSKVKPVVSTKFKAINEALVPKMLPSQVM